MKNHLMIIALILLTTCTEKQTSANPIESILSAGHPKIKRVMDSLDQYEVQIRYTQIDRMGDSVVFTNHDFQVNDSNYFYPASTVKFPIAVLALERLNQIDTLTMATRFYVEGDSVETTFAKAVSEIFSVSDN
ncbi:MAG: serine hydrolase, partial [Flavobacteriaceae bacterium]